jgi:hypothetical protein
VGWGRARRERDTAATCVTCGALSASSNDARTRARPVIYTPLPRLQISSASTIAAHSNAGPIEALPSLLSSQQLRRGRMGKGRAPCCAKVGLNRGSWTPEEDMRLIAYIQKHGHTNWRALPKQAGTCFAGNEVLASSHSHAVYMQVLTVTSSIRRFAAVREELPAAVDQLPPAGPQARQLHRRGGGDHHKAARHARQQVRTAR